MIGQLQSKVGQVKTDCRRWKENMDQLAADREAVTAQLASAETQLRGIKVKVLAQAKKIEELEAELARARAEAGGEGEEGALEEVEVPEDKAPEDAVPEVVASGDVAPKYIRIISSFVVSLAMLKPFGSETQDLLTGGTDTSAVAVEWAFQELLRNPKVIEKANQELDRVNRKERWIEEEDFCRLPYIDAIIKETFRLHPLCALLPPHYSIEDCEVAGYDIPNGTTVFVNAWSLGRNPKYWDRAEEFIPERLLENDIDIKGQNFTLLPFGSGRRRCPGYSLGIKVVRTTIANLLHGFNWKLTGGMKAEDISMEEIYGLTTHPKKPTSIIMEPRLSIHLY
ncbi:PREDICTED: cytochrome P450 71A1-like [Nicotiana attenuata]|uniref:cytochrome P450 71A1-like n=1 Tax=Nicotiana attenuata TaxID=49451 RepID=UPI00090490F0|nr:PREDICTED: cytochrome P450 71A1-like [Nicotiana attenuata]